VTDSTINRLIRNSQLKVAISALSLGLCIFATYYFLIVLKTAIIYTHLFYIPIVITCAWWGRKGIVFAASIVIFLLAMNFLFAPNVSLIDNLARSAILLSVSILTSAILVSKKKTEEKLSFLKTFNENVVESIGDALLVIDPNSFRIISVNDATLKQLKLSKNDLIGKTCHEVTHHRSTPCEPPHDICPIHEMLTTGMPVSVEHRHFDQENRRIDVEVSVHPIKDNNGKIIQAVHIDRDITTRKEQEREEKTKADEFRGIVDGIGDLLFVIDKNRVITKVNKATCDTFKKTPEELIGKHCYEIVHGTEAPWCNCPATKTFETKQTVTEEVNDPNLGIPLLVTTSPVLDEQGEVTQVIHIAKDITKIKLAEMEIHIAANLFGAASDSILVHDLDGKIVYFNEAAYKTRGYTRDEFQALTVQDLESPDNPRFFGAQIKELSEKGEATFEAVNLRKDKKVLPIEIHAQLIESDNRKLILSVARDISERKAAEEKLAESQEKYETTFESSMDALMLLDEKGFFDCNTATLSLFGCKSVEEFTKNHPADLSPTLQPDGSSSLESANQHIKKAMLSGKDHFFWVHKRTDGIAFPADVLLTRIHLKNRDVLQATVRDITERKKAEEAIKKSQEEYSSLFANMVDGFAYCQMIFDESEKPVDFVYLQINDAFEKITGLKREIIVGKNVTQAIPGIIEDNSELFEIYGRVARTGQTERFEIFFKPLNMWLHISVYCPRKGYFAAIFEDTTERKQAEQRLKEAEEKHRTLLNVANVLVQSVDVGGKYLFVNEEWKNVLGYTDVDLEKITMMDVIRKDHLQYCMSVFKKIMDGLSIHDVETVFVAKDGQEIVVSGNACPVFKDGKFISTVAFFVDITERKKNEEKLKENSKRIELMVEKLRVVGSLTRHDVRNKLSTVTGYAYLLKKKHADQADIIEGLSKMEQSVKETIRIFDFAKMYEQLGAEELAYINVEAKLTEATTLFSGSLPKIINQCHGLSVLADSFLRQLFYNFIDNTKKYGQKTTTIRVHYEKTDQDNLKLVYEDDGVGVPLENKTRLFKEGFSTGGSTGFGLFLTKKMMDVYGWKIEENGEPDKGAKFTMTIPKINQNGKENFQISCM
jgi:PAS domain S-box-containing protein